MDLETQKEIRVKIKTWEEMKNTYGVHPHTNIIDCEYDFTTKMESLIPTNRVITVYLGKWQGYSISEDMVEKILIIDNNISHMKRTTLIKGN